MTLDLRGVFVALVTPLDEHRQLDHADVGALLHRAADDGLAGVLVAGTTGEGTLLEPTQRAALTRTARTNAEELAVAGTTRRPLVLAGASGPSPAALHADVEQLAEAGADAVLVLAPHTYPLTPEELVDVHLEVAEQAAVPTLVYHLPQLTGSALTADALAELAAHPNIVGIKDSSSDAERRAAFVAAVVDRDLAVLSGHGPSLHAALRDGASGSITAIANVRPRQVVRLHAAVADGDHDTAAQVQRTLARTEAALGALQASLPAVIKAALQLDGLVTERWCRPPLRSVPPARLDAVRSALLR
ncbi:dihydrodipicolinate synthase family protein [Egicoccus halophilus]|uniref:Dihydrodipicolinate synthase family protein n=2 Tax=Egicoccus halophilus TaxID=1670830 RepID=A0A8J3AAG4_9ACTN|nr:dihydrodipicolinate synthase family protein [Egicoccus halophilus]